MGDDDYTGERDERLRGESGFFIERDRRHRATR
jgi:hypothetical protein